MLHDPRFVGLDPHHPCQVAYEGYTVLVTRPDGDFDPARREGLFDYDTRILSRHSLRVNGEALEAGYATVPRSDEWSGWMCVRRRDGTPEGPLLPQDLLSVLLVRRVGQGMWERLALRNYGGEPFAVELRLALDADFSDLAKIGAASPSGEVQCSWDDDRRALVFDYAASRDDRSVHRALAVELGPLADAELSVEGSTLCLRLELAPRAAWAAELHFCSLVDGEWRRPAGRAGEQSPRHRLRAHWHARRTRIESTAAAATELFERAARDLADLRNWELDGGTGGWVPNAGVPAYTGLFGRDALVAGWQAALLGPEMLRGTLAQLAATQATGFDPWRDAEPGKLAHEVRRGPCSELNLIPQRCYYGTLTTASLFVIALSELWHWTGDRAALRRYRAAAERALAWAREHGDRDGDGFLEYVQQSPAGLKNHGWKDSAEAIRYADGRLVPDPIAPVEEQVYHAVALERMAGILVALGEPGEAAEHLARARRLRARWDEVFWMEDEGFYALALGPDKALVRTIASNPGHALAAGMVPAHRAARVVARLLAPDLFSGWGIRTLSAAHPSYNAFGYHLGTVWPVENAVIALGMKRYGFDEEAERLVTALVDAAAYYLDMRLPEAMSGLGPSESPVPVPYPSANSPQAWSASACIQLFQTMLGLAPYAPAHLLALTRPRLPAGIDELVLRDLRVGEATVTLRFTRRADGSARHTVLERRGRLRVLEIPPPSGPAAERTRYEQAKLALLRRVPGAHARQIRIALGTT